jgi:hypothetical protein
MANSPNAWSVVHDGNTTMEDMVQDVWLPRVK